MKKPTQLNSVARMRKIGKERGAALVIALLLLLLLTRALKLPAKLGVLLGVGTAICGGTAIVATAPVIEAEEKDVVFSVATVTLLGLIAMFTLPIIGQFLHLTSKAFGIWAGLAIHQTPQVIAAGFSYSPEAGGTATIVKLARVCLLAPVVFIAKSEVARWPVFGWLAKLQRTIFIDRGRRQQTGAATKEIAGRLVGGDAVVLFAEGTSSEGTRTLPFRSALVGAVHHALGDSTHHSTEDHLAGTPAPRRSRV